MWNFHMENLTKEYWMLYFDVVSKAKSNGSDDIAVKLIFAIIGNQTFV